MKKILLIGLALLRKADLSFSIKYFYRYLTLAIAIWMIASFSITYFIFEKIDDSLTPIGMYVTSISLFFVVFLIGALIIYEILNRFFLDE